MLSLQNFQHFKPTDMQAHKYLSEGKTAHKEANISGWIIVPTPTQLSKQHSPSRTSNTSNQSIRTPSTCAANFSEGKMVLTCSVLAQLSQQNFLHFNPIDRHTSTCASNIQHPQNFQHFNPTDRPQVPVWPTCAVHQTLQPNR